LHSSGEECLPHKITLGDFVKICRSPDFDPEKTAFFMATAHGPCRFGQYAPYLKKTLKELGYGDVMVFSPTSKDGYNGVAYDAPDFKYTLWMAVVAGDITTKMLLKTRPYELRSGDSDEVFEHFVGEIENVLSKPRIKPRYKLVELVNMIERMRIRFRSIPAKYVKGRPLIGLVGEIFCRWNTFSNDDVARRVEKFGGECWLADVAEWVWYTNWHHWDTTFRTKGRINLDMLGIKIKSRVMQKYEHALYGPVVEDFKGYEEPNDVREMLDNAEPYLPRQGCLGEMVLSIGKTLYLQGKGADGIIDISPFTCMNGIICEGVYPMVSADHDNLPIRMCYFDGVETNIDRDIEIFLDLARAYQGRKKYQRIYPDYFK